MLMTRHDARALPADAHDAPVWVAMRNDKPGAWPADAHELCQLMRALPADAHDAPAWVADADDAPVVWPAGAHEHCQLMLMMRGLCRLILTGFAS